MGRADDHPGQALAYYSSRGETPLRWAGALAERLGLVGVVTEEQYDAVMAPGGFRDPLTGERLVNTKNPYVEIVIAAHKATALLGVVGRAEDMHVILDVERDATMAWLEASLQATGGRRGRQARVTPTTGLVFAQTRHGTSRAGDPSPHDHIMIANLTEMLDDKGGWKALYTALLRDRVEAATMVGRLHSAARAVELGYAIELDNGPSGRLRHWRIKGIPQEVCDAMSKRSDAIGEYLSDKGYVGYRARNIAARATREIKRQTGVDELMPRWEAELAEIGWPIDRIVTSLEAARLECPGLAPALTATEIDQIAARLMDPEGDFLRRGKVFGRSRLTAEVAPLLYGHDPAELDRVLDRIIASELVVPLIGIAGVREQVYSARVVLETEQAIANCVQRLLDADGPRLDPACILRAIAAKQNDIGAELSDGQYAAINAVCGSGRAVDVIVGIAGSGKTTALDAAASALEEAGYAVIGTATAGQAARTLGIEARTMRSLLKCLDRGTLTLDHKSVVILDEAGMTADTDMARLLIAVEAARAKVVIVGDDRQLSAVGPGGALHALLGRHPEIVTTLTENLRQSDPAERDTLLHLRSGDLEHAIGWYATNDRITIAPDRTQALVGIVNDYIDDVEAGADTFMLAWQRNNVADLNRIARDAARQRGWLTGPDLELPDGRLFAQGDLVVLLAPNYENQLVTSERAQVIAVDHHAQAVTIETDHGRHVTLLGTELAADRIDYGYAITVHREQGATSDRTHYYADGGGRELAYVANSRARHHTQIHTVADNLDHAIARLHDDWSKLQHDTWITPTDIGVDEELARIEATRIAESTRLERELADTLALAPPDVTDQLTVAQAQLAALRAEREHLLAGTGDYHRTDAGRAIRQLHLIDDDLADAHAGRATARMWERHRWDQLIDTLQTHKARYEQIWDTEGVPVLRHLDERTTATENHVTTLGRRRAARDAWVRLHPEWTRRVRYLERAIDDIDSQSTEVAMEAQQIPAIQPARNLPTLHRHRGPDLEPPNRADDFGLGL